MPDWIAVGRHRYHQDGELVFVELHGDIERSDIERLWPVAEGVEAAHGYSITVFDARDAGSVSPAARQFVGEKNRQRTLVGPTVFIGAGFVMRTVAQLISQAARLFGKNPSPLFFCDTTHDLPQLLAEQRQAFAHVKKRPT